jgi:hypothetical protein
MLAGGSGDRLFYHIRKPSGTGDENKLMCAELGGVIYRDAPKISLAKYIDRCYAQSSPDLFASFL